VSDDNGDGIGASRQGTQQTARPSGPGQGRPGHARFWRLFGYTVLGIVLVLAALVGAGAWRLSQGPITLDTLTPYLSRFLSSGPNGIAVDIDHTVLSWRDRRLHLVATGMHLVQTESNARLTFRSVELDLNLRALLVGKLAPSRIALDQPDMKVEREPDGSLRLALGGEEDVNQPGAAEFWGTRLMSDIAEVTNGDGPFGYLTDVEIRDASLAVDDRLLGVTWHADHATLSLHRGAEGLTGTLQFGVGIAGNEALIRGSVEYQRAGKLGVAFDFDDLRPALFASAAPALEPLAALDLPISGELLLEIDTEKGTISVASGDLSFGEGELRNDDLPTGSVHVASGALHASYDPASGRVNLAQLVLDIGGPKMNLNGTVENVGNGLLAGGWPQTFDVALKLAVQDFPLDDLPWLWPERVGSLSRRWITKHIHDGIVDEMDASLDFHVDITPDAPKPVVVKTFEGSGAFHNMTIEYFPGLEPVRGADGTAVFDRTQIVFTPRQGHVLTSQVLADGTTVRLYKLDTNDETADVDVHARGPLADPLKVLDTKPLEYAKALGLDAQHAEGSFEAHMFFRLPLKHDLNLDEVEYHTEAELHDVAIPHALFNRDLSAGDFKMTLNRTQLTLDGDAAVAGVPMKITWGESFVRKDTAKRRYTVHARIDDAGRQRLGLTFDDFALIHGPMDLDLVYGLAADKRAQATVTVDLKDSQIDMGKFGWSKKAGGPATLKFALDLSNDAPTALRDATLQGSGIDARASAAFDKDGLTRVDVTRLVAGWTNAAATLAKQGAGWLVTVQGKSYDAGALLDDLSRQLPSNAAPPPLTIDATLDSLVLGEGREIKKLNAHLQSNGLHWTEARVDGELTETHPLTVRFGGDQGAGKFNLKAADFGALLQVLDVTDNVLGGTFEINGDAVDLDGKRVLKGVVDGADYRVVRAPLFARLLSVASLSGANALLTGQGIPFTVLKADVVYGSDSIAVSNLRAYGGALGINVDGKVDNRANTIDASGTLVPAYTINSVLGYIPWLGKLILGGEGQGIFAANFRIAGPLSDPQVSVNPLSALAPGALRQLFMFQPFDPTPPAPSQTESTAPAPNGAEAPGPTTP